MFATKQYAGPFWQGVFLTAAFCLLSFDSARAVTEQPVDYSPAELEELVGPVALYPDDLIGIILPASTYPLQIVQAARYLEEHEKNPELQPDEDWDDSVVALLNYPEVIELMNEDLDWTWNLGEAVVNQQADVLDAIQVFRGRAVDAGNFESDDRQTINVVDDVIEVTPVDPEVIYVPYYEPSRVVVYQRWPVYHYYPTPYPLYYYPYPVRYSFASGFFWGVTTAYTIGWLTDRVHFHYYGYASHPYYGHTYTGHYYSRHARRVRHYNYVKPRSHFAYNKRYYGNTWKPTHRYGHRPRHRDSSPDHHQAVASDFTSSSRRNGSAGDTRVRSSGERQTRNGFRSNRNDQNTASGESRNRNTLTNGNRRRRADDAGSNTRIAVVDQSAHGNTSRRTGNRGSRPGNNQVIDTRSQRRTGATADTRTTRRNQNASLRSGSSQVIDTRSQRSSGNRSDARARRGADTSRRTARQTRDTNSTQVNRTATRVNRSTATPRRTETRAQPRQQSRQASQVRQTDARSQPQVRSANSSNSRSNNRSTTRVASAPRSSGGGRQSRGGRAAARSGHRR